MWTRNAMESLGIDGWAGEIAEYIDRLIFRIDTRETGDEIAIKGAVLAATGKEAFTLPKTYTEDIYTYMLKIYTKTLRDTFITEIQYTILRNVRPPQLGLVERAKFHTLGLKA